jgi:hypothetical protein
MSCRIVHVVQIGCIISSSLGQVVNQREYDADMIADMTLTTTDNNPYKLNLLCRPHNKIDHHEIIEKIKYY